MRSDLQPARWNTFRAPTAAWACVLVGDRSQLPKFLDDASSLDVWKVVIDGSRCSNSRELFKEVASALEFPDYFGHNWAALNDCLFDLSWHPASSHVVVITNINQLLTDKEELQLFLEIARDGAALGARGYGWPPHELGEGTVRFVFHAGDAVEARTWDERLRALGIEMPYYSLA